VPCEAVAVCDRAVTLVRGSGASNLLPTRHPPWLVPLFPRCLLRAPLVIRQILERSLVVGWRNLRCLARTMMGDKELLFAVLLLGLSDRPRTIAEVLLSCGCRRVAPSVPRTLALTRDLFVAPQLPARANCIPMRAERP
jgi:hypothetical protein